MLTYSPYVPERKSEPESESRKAVRTMTDEGKSPREISVQLGISTQRVYHHLKRIRATSGRSAA